MEDLTLQPDKEACQALCAALYKCTGPFKRMVSPLLPYPLVLNKLHRDLVEAEEMSGGSAEECLLTFAMKMEEPDTKAFLDNEMAGKKSSQSKETNGRSRRKTRKCSRSSITE